MSIWGKVVGGAAGLALGGPLGAFIGAVFGHAFDESREQGGAPADPLRDVAFTAGCIVLSAKLAKSDGEVTPPEVLAFRERFHAAPEELASVARLFDQARRAAHGYEPYARQIGKLLHDRPDVMEKLLGALFHIARADGAVTAEELVYLETVAALFGFGPTEFARIRATYGGAALAAGDPYAVLGAARAMATDEIKALWRKSIAENHPDRLTAQGLPPEFLALATEKAARLNEAWDRIKRERGAA